jgi:hypothetical protein
MRATREAEVALGKGAAGAPPQQPLLPHAAMAGPKKKS